jgi:hypothetical protein
MTVADDKIELLEKKITDSKPLFRRRMSGLTPTEWWLLIRAVKTAHCFSI